jgi:hypothetical protein
MSDVIHVDGSASTPCRVHDVIIVGESSSSTSSNTSRPATTDQIAAIAKQAAAVAGVSQFEVASAILKPPAAAHTLAALVELLSALVEGTSVRLQSRTRE